MLHPIGTILKRVSSRESYSIRSHSAEVIKESWGHKHLDHLYKNSDPKAWREKTGINYAMISEYINNFNLEEFVVVGRNLPVLSEYMLVEVLTDGPLKGSTFFLGHDNRNFKPDGLMPVNENNYSSMVELFEPELFVLE